jgi:soluble lytic murein transglycosylase-like protein
MLEQMAAVLARISEIEQGLAQVQGPANSSLNFAEILSEVRNAEGPSSPKSHKPVFSFDDIIRQAAAKHGLDPDLIHAVIQAESDYDPTCKSSAGAMGLMQLMPGTARALGVTNPWDPAANVDGGARYLRQQLDRFHDVDLALAAYNAGPAAVARFGGLPPYHETQAYVRRVLQTLWQRKGE